MSEPQPIPANLSERIVDFIEGAKTGRIVMNFNQGRIESYESLEFVRTAGKNRPSETT